MRKSLLFTALLPLLFVSGCLLPGGNPEARVTEQTLQTRFDAEAARNQLRAGDNTIVGSALFPLQDGDVRFASGKEVFLIPSTEYARERMLKTYGNLTRGYRSIGEGVVTFAGTPQEYVDLQKSTMAGARGEFKFTGLADGEYFVVTGFTWRWEDRTHKYLSGGYLMHKVSVSGGETREIVLAP